MKTAIVLLALGVIGLIRSDPAAFAEFQAKYNRVYASRAEAAKRYEVFRRTLEAVAAHNSQPNATYEMGINQFSDLTFAEFAQVYLEPEFLVGHRESLPTAVPAVDWRNQGAVTRVKDQASCGSCYSFGAIGSTEGRCQIAIKTLHDLSDQQCVDCSGGYGNSGCDGGRPEYCFNYYKAAGGVMLSKDYPYTGHKGSCVASATKMVVTITGYSVGRTEKELQDAIVKGPTAVGLYATANFQNYKSGVFIDTTCPNFIANHALTAVGMGTLSGQDYYIIKNSWGATWGESGYVRFAANHNNMCAVGSNASWPNGCAAK